MWTVLTVGGTMKNGSTPILLGEQVVATLREPTWRSPQEPTTLHHGVTEWHLHSALFRPPGERKWTIRRFGQLSGDPLTPDGAHARLRATKTSVLREVWELDLEGVPYTVRPKYRSWRVLSVNDRVGEVAVVHLRHWWQLSSRPRLKAVAEMPVQHQLFLVWFGLSVVDSHRG